MLTNQLLEALRPMIGFRPDDTSTEQTDNLTPELEKTSTGVTLDQCHELLQLSTLRKAYRQNVANFPAYLDRTRDDAIRAKWSRSENNACSGPCIRSGLS